MKTKNRAKTIDEMMRLIWSSLESHLEWTHEHGKDGDMKFHKKCVKEYVKMMKLTSDLY